MSSPLAQVGAPRLADVGAAPKHISLGIGGTPLTPPGSPAAQTAASAPTAQSAHNMLKAVGIELAFVVVATMLAGVSDRWASGMLALMLALLILRGLFEVDIFAAFAQGTALHK